jgi:vacuolar-type H+-ATPase subunit H
MSAFSWRCQYCSWAFQMSSDSVAAALAAADATQARHHVEHCPRCRKALKIPVDQLRHHAPLSAPAASPAPIQSLSFQEDKKPMTDLSAPFPPVEPQAPEPEPAPTPAPIELPAPTPAEPLPVFEEAFKLPPAQPKEAAKNPAKKAKKPVKKAKKAAKKPVKKAKKPVKKAAKKPVKKAKKPVRKAAKKPVKKAKKPVKKVKKASKKPVTKTKKTVKKKSRR